MSERFKAAENVNDSKNTRLPIAAEFANYRFGRDALAHLTRYMFICEQIVALSKELKRPLSVLDVGCGDIYVARVLQSSFKVKKSKVFARYVGLDIDDKSLKRSAETQPKSFPIELLCGDVTNGALAQFSDGEFDVLINTEVVEHIQPHFVEPLLQEFNRVAHRGYISTPNVTGGTGSIPEDHIKEWDTDELKALMTHVGIQVVDRIGIFCNLNKVRKLAKRHPNLQQTLDVLSMRMDSHLLSLVLARYVGKHAQNILYVCNFRGAS